MKLISVFFLWLAFYGLSLSAQESTTESTTEASNSMMQSKLDFCCDRDKTEESAQDMSEQEANQIVRNTLPSASYKRPRSGRPSSGRPSSGQR